MCTVCTLWPVHVHSLYSLTCASVQSVLSDMYKCTVCTLGPVLCVQSVLSDLYCVSNLYSLTCVHVYRLYSLTCICEQSVLCDLYMCTVCTLWPVQVYSLYSLTCASVQSVLSDLYCESSLYSLTCVHVYSLYSLTCTACPVSWQRPCPSSSPVTHSSTNGTNSSYNKRPSNSGDGKWTNTQQVPSPRFREIFCPFNKIVFLAPFPYSSPTSIVRFKMQMNKKKRKFTEKKKATVGYKNTNEHILLAGRLPVFRIHIHCIRIQPKIWIRIQAISKQNLKTN